MNMPSDPTKQAAAPAATNGDLDLGAVDEVINTIHTHPTLSEAILEAAEDYHGMGIHTRPKKKK